MIHDAQFKSSQQSHHWKSSALHRTITPTAARRYRTIITPSAYAREEVLRYDVCKRDDIHVIYSAGDHILRREHDPHTLAELGLTKDGYILAVSQVHAHKNIKTIFEALRGPPLVRKLVLVGGHGPQQYQESKIEIPEGVRFLGRLPDSQLVELFSNARMFLYPSTTEGFGFLHWKRYTLDVQPSAHAPERCRRYAAMEFCSRIPMTPWSGAKRYSLYGITRKKESNSPTAAPGKRPRIHG